MVWGGLEKRLSGELALRLNECYIFIMSAKPKSIISPPVVVPVDDETRAMLNYAASAEGRAKIERAHQELREGKGIVATESYFEKLNRRISDRVKKGGRSGP